MLGQSYGGFCVAHVPLDRARGVREALITGGLPSLERPADDVYGRRTAAVLDKNEAYYAAIRRIRAGPPNPADHLRSAEVRCPTATG